MSYTRGECTFSDGQILYYVYQGSMDLCYANLKNENEFNWETNKTECTCGQLSEYVFLNDNYGSFSLRSGEACRKCMCITEGLDPYKQLEESLTMSEKDQKIALGALRRLYDQFGSEWILTEMRFDGLTWASVDWRLHELDSEYMIKQLEEWDNEN